MTVVVVADFVVVVVVAAAIGNYIFGAMTRKE